MNIITLHRELLKADDKWSDELFRAFGKDACNRRYDWDKTNHPANCQAAYNMLQQCRARFEASGGYARLFGHS
jgi:hypothetical protein